MKRLVKGYIPPKKSEDIGSQFQSVIKIANELKKTQARVEQIANDIKETKQGPKGQDADENRIVSKVLARIPRVDEQAILAKVPKVDEERIIKKALSRVPTSKPSLKVLTEKVETDPMSVIEKIMAMPPDKFKLKSTQIDGLQQTISAFHNQLGPRGYLHGGGDTVVAGTGITITTNSNGNKVITNSGASGTVTSVASADGSITVTNPTTTVDLAVVKSPKLTTARTISISGDLTYTSPSFDGSANVTAAGTLATVNANVGSFTNANITVNAKGLITAASNGSAGSGTVTSVSVATANGFSGTVADATTTPAITIIAGAITPTSVNGLTITSSTGTLTIANGKTLTSSNTLTLTATDGSTLAIGTGGTLGTAAYTAATAYEVPLTFGDGLTRTANDVDVDAAQPGITTAVNLPWTGLATGTDGQIPTFDSSGNPAFVATGTATHVLTSNGAGAAPTFQAASSGTSALTLIPKPFYVSNVAPSSVQINTNTTAFLAQVNIPFPITVNKISIRSSGSVPTPGTLDLSMYTEDGQTQKFSVTTASINAADTIFTTAVSSVALTPGVYYIMVNGNGTLDISSYFYTGGQTVFNTTAGLPYDVASEPIMEGTLTISAGAPPATFSPTGITESTTKTIIFRLDN